MKAMEHMVLVTSSIVVLVKSAKAQKKVFFSQKNNGQV